MIRAVLESHFDLFSLHEQKIILAYSNTFDAEVSNTFCATVKMNPVYAELQMNNFPPALIPSFMYIFFLLKVVHFYASTSP